MQRNIDLIAFKKPCPSQQRRSGKPRFLRSKDLLAALSAPGVVLGQTRRGVYISMASTVIRRDDISLLLLTADGDPQIIKDTFESIFLSESVGPVELASGEIDLRQFADGVFSGIWHVFEEEGFSFMILADAGYEIRLSEWEALETFTKIIRALKAR